MLYTQIHKVSSTIALMGLFVLALPAPVSAIARVDENGNYIAEPTDGTNQAEMRTMSLGAEAPADGATTTAMPAEGAAPDDTMRMQTMSTQAAPAEADAMAQSAPRDLAAAEVSDENTRPLFYASIGAFIIGIVSAAILITRLHRRHKV